jgi:prepilin-type N-terminal cleavage/methylation domain-containing protein
MLTSGEGIRLLLQQPSQEENAPHPSSLPEYREREKRPDADSPMKSAARGIHSAFTMIEMVMSVVIVSVLLLAIGSVLRLTNYVDAASASDAGAAAQSADLASGVVADLNVAENFTEDSSASCTFTVPDRTGSAGLDTIRYSWTGASAQTNPAIPAYSLARSFNGGAPVVIAGNVTQFNLRYLYRLMNPPAQPTLLQMAAYDPSGSSGSDWAITVGKNSAAQVFVPSTPAGTTSWTLAQVRLYARSNTTPDGIVQVQVRTVDSQHRPTATVLASALLAEASLNSSDGWVTVPFALANCSPTQPLAVVVNGTAGATCSCYVQYVNGASPSPPGTAYASQSTNGGTTWATPTNTWSYRFYVYGTVP